MRTTLHTNTRGLEPMDERNEFIQHISRPAIQAKQTTAPEQRQLATQPR